MFVMVLMPVLLPRHLIKVFTITFIFAILGSGWNIASGYAGQGNLGIAFMYCAGSYASAILNAKFGLPVWISIVFGTLVATGLGIIPGLISLRLSGSYLALATLTLPIILSTVILYVLPQELTGGDVGLFVSPLTKDPILEYYTVFVILLFSLLFVWKITSSKVGLFFRIIREDEEVAKASGINTYLYKILAFILCGFLAGLSGSLYSFCVQVISPYFISFSTSFEPIIWTIMGGASTVYGPLVGALILHVPASFLRGYLGTFVDYLPFAMLILLAFAPRGIGVWIVSKLRKVHT
jgi:branched-chain amino acid transport system permease protein